MLSPPCGVSFCSTRRGPDNFSRTRIQTVKLPSSAILDIQWSSNLDLSPLLAVATSTGTLAFYTFHSDHDSWYTAQLRQHSVHLVADPSILVLSLAWHLQDPSTIGVTLSSGAVALCSSSVSKTTGPWDDSAVVDSRQIHSHDLEAWTLAFLPAPPAVDSATSVLSGGDDCVLRLKNGWSDRKTHGAGVTAILPLDAEGDEGCLVLTGSYDDHLRLIRCPAVGRREVLAEIDLGGGVWRLAVLNDRRYEEHIEGKELYAFTYCGA